MMHRLAVQHLCLAKGRKSNSSSIKNGFEDFLRFKNFAGQSTSSAGMFGVVRINYFHRHRQFRPKIEKIEVPACRRKF